MTAIFAPDTNFFLQCKDAGDLDWSAVTNSPSVLLVVLKEVLRELDAHKGGGNSRRARRARKFNSVVRQLVREDEVCLREQSPSVTIRMAPMLDPKREKPASLDVTCSDDRIIEEAKACSECHFNGDLVLLTNDATPLHTAKAHGLKACDVPDAWLLPPEPNEQDRQIRELKERVSLLEGRAPALQVKLAGEAAGRLTFYPALSEAEIDNLVEALRRACPEKRWHQTVPGGAFSQMFRPPENRIEDYGHAYASWIEEARRFLSHLSDFHNRCAQPVTVLFVLSNTGESAADQLVVDVSTQGPLRLVDPDEEEQEMPALSAPPVPPEFAFGSGAGYDTDISRLLGRLPGGSQSFPMGRDRHEFYWDYDSPVGASEHCRAVCEDFRHGLRDEQVELLLRWVQPTADRLAGALKLKLSARNIASATETVVPVRIEVEVGDTEVLARSLIQQILGVRI